VNKATHDRESEKTQKPQYDENNSDSIKHSMYPFFFGLVFNTAVKYGPTQLFVGMDGILTCRAFSLIASC
jgi:hypothetical protein